MNQLPLSYLITAASLAAAVACGWLCFRLTRQAREAVQHLLAIATEHEGALDNVRHQLSSVSQSAVEQSRRLARLETNRVAETAQQGPAKAPDIVAPAPIQPLQNVRLGITERRHRVLALARRGLEVGVIATSLGLPHGEVELIIEINKAALESRSAFN
jgi:hypothetical protein